MSKMNSITIPRNIVNAILKLAQSDSEKEICGLISCDATHNMQLYPVTNISSSADTLFEMDPAETINAMKQMRNDNAELFAIFHSHPHSPAYPSKTDIEQAGYPDALYLIISLNTKGVLELKGYKIQQDSVSSVDLVL